MKSRLFTDETLGTRGYTCVCMLREKSLCTKESTDFE